MNAHSSNAVYMRAPGQGSFNHEDHKKPPFMGPLYPSVVLQRCRGVGYVGTFQETGRGRTAGEQHRSFVGGEEKGNPTAATTTSEFQNSNQKKINLPPS